MHGFSFPRLQMHKQTHDALDRGYTVACGLQVHLGASLMQRDAEAQLPPSVAANWTCSTSTSEAECCHKARTTLQRGHYTVVTTARGLSTEKTSLVGKESKEVRYKTLTQCGVAQRSPPDMMLMA